MKLSRYIGVGLASAYFIHAGFTPNDWHFIDNVNLIFHEAGHTIFMFFGEFIHVLMGSGFQVLLPLLISIYFFFTKQKISGALTLAWIGQSLVNVSVYARDAVVMELPLLGGDSSGHDWNYLLGHMHLFRYVDTVANGIYGLGMTAIFAGVFLAFYFAATQKPELE